MMPEHGWCVLCRENVPQGKGLCCHCGTGLEAPRWNERDVYMIAVCIACGRDPDVCDCHDAHDRNVCRLTMPR